jgi:hypothetical protein
MEPETVEYAIKEVGKAILFVGFVGLIGLWFFSWYDDFVDRLGERPEAHSDKGSDTTDDVRG